MKKNKKSKPFINISIWHFISILDVFSFWGCVCFCILYFGFGISIYSIHSIAKSLEMNLAGYAIYILLSLVMFPIFLIRSIRFSMKYRFSIALDIQTWLYCRLRTPFDAFNVGWLFRLKSLGLDATGIRNNIFIYIIRLFETTLWWFILCSGVYTIYHQGNNIIVQAIEQKSVSEKVMIGCVCLAIYMFLWGIERIAKYIHKKKLEEKSQIPSYFDDSGTRGQKYYERFPERKPSRCRTCGGNYPDCRPSCNWFDD